MNNDIFKDGERLSDGGPVTEADVPAAESDLQTELDAANARADENYNKYLLATADHENYRKRIERQFGEIALAGRKKLLLSFLPVLDNLERALAHVDDGGAGLRNGLQQTLRGFEAILASEGVRPIAVKGAPFDHNIAEAIGTHARDGAEDGTVLEEVERGYKIGDELLRPAKVIVAKAASD